MAGIFTTASNFYTSVTSIPERNRQVGFLQTAKETVISFKNGVTQAAEKVKIAKKDLTEFTAKQSLPVVKVILMSESSAKALSKVCARKLYEFSGAGDAVSYVGRQSLDAVTNSSIVQNTIGSTGAKALNFVGSLLGNTAEDLLIEKFSETVFLPVVSAVQDKVLESRVVGTIDLAIKTGALYAIGGLGIVADGLDKLQKVATVAETVSTYANVGALAYVYGPTVVNGGKLAVQCCSLRCRMKKIERALDHIKLQTVIKSCGLNISESVVKKSMAGIIAICLESGGMSTAIDLKSLFSDEKMMTTIVKAAANALNLRK